MNRERKILLNLAILVIALCMAGWAAPAGAVTHYVSPGQSIQAAIDAASHYDEIEVAPGTYNEPINFIGKKVRLYSSGGPEVTTIDGTGYYHVVQCVVSEDADTILEGFTITGGNANGPGSNAWGGGMYCENSSPTVTNCTFSNNSATEGGGMYNSTSSPTVTDCIFSNNTATEGGGMYNSVSSPTVTNCTFYGNSADTGGGGGMYNYISSTAVTNCTFTDNTAGDDGGGMCNKSFSCPTVTNCIFHGNKADGAAYNAGGGMYNYDNSNPTLTNCTFYGNSADTGGGGGIYNYDSQTVTNCILWANVNGQIEGETGTVNYSCLEGILPPGTGNINANPCFFDAGEGDLRLRSSISPCVDAGDNNAPNLTATDLAGNARVVDGDWDGSAVVDMGAYELQPKQILNITQDTWYETIQTAINDANNGDQIEVGPDTYNEAINYNGKAVRLYSSGGPEVTTINGTGYYHVVQCVLGEDANTILEGFTITGGNADGTDFDAWGGGMFNYGSSPTVTNCTFSGNSADDAGGGMLNVVDSSPSVTNCTFTGNSAGWGGGVYNNQSSSPTITGCTFAGNEVTDEGGGMYNANTSTIHPTVTNCTFTGNSALPGGYGGGLFNYSSSPDVSNCLFSGNVAADGGGMNNNASDPMVTNCTFSGNSATRYSGGMHNTNNSNPKVTNCIFNNNEAESYGGGIGNYNGSGSSATNCTFSGNVAFGGGGIRNSDSSPIVVNCILWDNEPDEISSGGTSSPAVIFSDVQGDPVYPGTGNINADPCFVDANNPDPNLVNLRVLPDSPCIDAGNTIGIPLGISLDLDGKPRGVDDPQTPDTGVSFLGVTVDMGAYEFQPCPIPGDINCDGVVDFKDLAILCANWLEGTEPE